MKKMRKYEEGGDVVDETGMSFGTIKRNTETGELYDTEGSFKPVPKSMPVTETKAKTEPKKESKKETKEESKAESKKSAKEQAKEVIKPPKLPESFEKAGGGKEVPYAGPIHFGWPARRIKPQPFFYDAIDGRRDEIKDRYEKLAQEITRRRRKQVRQVRRSVHETRSRRSRRSRRTRRRHRPRSESRRRRPEVIRTHGSRDP